MTDANLARWIKASVGKYIADRVGSVYLHIDGQKDNTADKNQWLELYVLGPSSVPQHRDCVRYVEVLVGCVSEHTTDIHAVARIQGLIQSILDNDIPIFRYGPTNPNPDDQSLITCLRLRADVPRAIDTMDFGMISHRDITVRRVTVEGQYEMRL